MKIVLDSTPLIYLNRAGLSWVFGEFETFIPRSVFEEVVLRGKEFYKKDALVAEKLVNDGKIVVEFPSVTVEARRILAELGEGELQAIALAKQKNAVAIIDDDVAKGFGEIFGVDVHGTFFLISLLVHNKKLSKAQAVKKIQEMIKLGWRVSVDKYLEFVELITKL
ncbi:MAG: DUF3368 domain-containing protein [Candidatus Diapherotrites archaeon]|nr:DUF3368 domain-containing protein [Candidatus Diapherotrites archaeon]